MKDDRGHSKLTNPEASAATLLRMAWGVEFLAAGTGLLIALVTLLASTGGSEVGGAPAWSVALVAALPFVLVALAELTKVPLASAFYHTPRGPWKVLFFVGLLVLMAVTFETMLTGLETNFSTRTREVKGLQARLVGVQEELAAATARATDLEALTEDQVRARAEAAQRGAAAQYEEALSSLRAEREAKRSEVFSGLGPLDAEANELKARVAATRARHAEAREALQAERVQEVARLASLAKDERDQVKRQLEEIRDGIQALDRQEAGELQAQPLAGLLGGRGRVERKYQERRTALVARRVTLEAKLDEALAPRASSLALEGIDGQLAVLERDHQRELTAAREERSVLGRATRGQRETLLGAWEGRQREFDAREQRLVERNDERIEELAGERDRQLEDWRGSAATLVALRTRVDGLSAERLAVRRELEGVAASSQVHRVAQLLSGEEMAADVSPEQLRAVSIAWFGSLAAIVAWTGTLLALAAHVVAGGRGGLAAPGANRRPRGQGRSALRSLRRLFVAERRRRGRRVVTTEVREVVKEVPVEKIMVKEVVKEVPVEKVVVKEIDKVVVKEVPVEKVVPGETITIRKTEIKYVPVPMNDIDPLISSPPYLEGSDGQPATVARLSA